MNVTHWPLFQLRARTSRLELRLPTIEELDALAELSTEGVHDPDQMPFAVPWTDQPPAERARGLMQFHWEQMANWTPQDWNLQLGVFVGGGVADGVRGRLAGPDVRLPQGAAQLPGPVVVGDGRRARGV